MTRRTYAVLEVSSATYDEIRTKLDAAGYAWTFHRDDAHGILIDMDGIALKRVDWLQQAGALCPKTRGCKLAWGHEGPCDVVR